MERSMTEYKRQDKIRNIDLSEETKLTDIITRIEMKWSRKVTEWNPRDGKRNRGRQHLRWKTNFIQQLDQNGEGGSPKIGRSVGGGLCQ